MNNLIPLKINQISLSGNSTGADLKEVSITREASFDIGH